LLADATFTVTYFATARGDCRNLLSIEFTPAPGTGNLTNIGNNDQGLQTDDDRVRQNTQWAAPGTTVAYQVKSPQGTLYSGSFVMGS
jgi:hypothetical protein